MVPTEFQIFKSVNNVYSQKYTRISFIGTRRTIQKYPERHSEKKVETQEGK